MIRGIGQQPMQYCANNASFGHTREEKNVSEKYDLTGSCVFILVQGETKNTAVPAGTAETLLPYSQWMNAVPFGNKGIGALKCCRK